MHGLSMAPEVRAFIGLGSNLGNPVEHLQEACSALAGLPQTRLVRCSDLYRSHPMGPGNQPDYINAVAEIITRLSPDTLLSRLQEIEARQGRVRDGSRWHARTIDLDILLYGDLVLATENLKIPHSGMHQRAFVLYPLAELDPDLVIPGRGSVRECLEAELQGEIIERLGSKHESG